ncbi:MAG: TatD family hydrolase [Planctomycetota bacterium]
MIDAHAHVGDPGFDHDRDEVLARAAAAGLRGIVCVGQDTETSLRALEVKKRGLNTNHITDNNTADKLQFVATAGLHPHEAKRSPDELPRLEQLLRTGDFAAVGETGLDFYYDYSPREIQRESFRWHLQIAKELLLPVVVHVRDAHAEAVEDIQSAGGGVVTMIHCFTGNATNARNYLDLGSYISFSGILTFKTAGEIRDAARMIPADRILVETDCPFLAPIPFRGKRCEPSFVVHTLQFLAEVRGDLKSTIDDATTENALRVFWGQV